MVLFQKKDGSAKQAEAGGAIQLPWHRRFWEQYVVLLYKQGARQISCYFLHRLAIALVGSTLTTALWSSAVGLLALRSFWATLTRSIIAPFVFIALIWVVNEAVTKNNKRVPLRSVH
jgi:hypothetical protein